MTRIELFVFVTIVMISNDLKQTNNTTAKQFKNYSFDELKKIVILYLPFPKDKGKNVIVTRGVLHFLFLLMFSEVLLAAE